MIKLNSKKTAAYTLVFATDKDLENNVLLKDSKDAFYISDKEEKIFLKLNEKAEDKRKELKNKLTSFVMKNTMDVNIDLDGFINGFADAGNFGEEKLFNVIVETISFNTAKKYVDKKEVKETPEVLYNLITKSTKFKTTFEKAVIKSDLVNYARELQDTPPNVANSEWIADKIAKDAKEYPGVKVKVLGLKEAQKLGMGLLLAVNAGSGYEPKVVIAEYVGDSSKEKTVLVGKGITFDSGGYNLKPSQFMEGMKFDKSGAIIMISTVFALAKANAKANVTAVGMFTDNRIGQNATLPESVIKSMNGYTVQIDNTDAEGRLVLADGITYAVRNLEATRVIEASTLTGSITIALGPWATGGFTKDNKLWEEAKAASEFTGETIWRMPMFPEHLEKMKNTPIADLTNSEPGRSAGSSTAAAFLNEFAEGKPYLHLDIAGTADNGKRGTGVMVKTLFELLSK